MIKRFNSFYKKSNDFTLEVLNESEYLLPFMNENHNFNFYVKDNHKQIQLQEGDKEILRHIEEKIEEYLDNSINPLNGRFMKKKTGEIIDYFFYVVSTEHFILKYLRQKYEDPNGDEGIITPEIYEGIKMLQNNTDTIARYMHNGIISDGNYVIVRSTDDSQYTMILYFEHMKNNTYNIILITQMKGFEVKPKRFDKTIKLHPNGEIIKNP